MGKKITITIISLVIILSIFLYSCSTIKNEIPPKTPQTYPEKTEIIIHLGDEFTLVKTQSAIIEELNVSLKVKDFIYSPCPEGSQCVWSGLTVVYEFSVDGKIYEAPTGNLPPEAPYDVFVKDTDYKTYATFVIDEPENRCTTRSGSSQDECWRGLAKRFDDESYCDNIQTLITKDACYEDLAEDLSNEELCEKVQSPKQYCQYLKLVAQDAIDQCDSIIKFHWRARCFKEISEKGGEGIDICNTLEFDKEKVCREMISGPDY